MNITLLGEDVATLRDKDPVGFCHGYHADKIEMQPGDFDRLADKVSTNPMQAIMVLRQLEVRFAQKRLREEGS